MIFLDPSHESSLSFPQGADTDESLVYHRKTLIRRTGVPSKMKIAITSEFLCHTPFTGVEYYLHHLLNGLSKKKGLKVTAILPPGTPEDRIPEGAGRQIHSPIRFLGTNFFSSLIHPPKGMDAYDIVHCPTVVAPFFFHPASCGKPKIIMTVHDIIPILFPQHTIPRRRFYFRHILKHRLRHVDHFIVPSMATRRDLMERFHIDPGRIDVTPEGVSSKFSFRSFEKKDYILAVSTLEPRKNFRRIIDSFIEIKKKYEIKENLIIVGTKGWYYNEILRIPPQFRECIIFKGYQPEENLIRLYQEAKVFVYPSLYEGFGLPILEAMAAGCPVITSSLSSMPEVGENAVQYVDPYSRTELSRAMLHILRDDSFRNDLIRKGLTQARKFTWERCVSETIDIYEKVISI